MLNNEKIIVMTKLSLYEKKNENREIKTAKFYRGDYIALKMIASFVLITVAYALGAGLWLLYNFDRIPEFLYKTQTIFRIVRNAAIIYLASVAIYMLISYLFFSWKFRKIRNNLQEYNGDLKTLSRIQDQEFDNDIEPEDEDK